MTPCIFCEIAAGRAPASPVYRDELCLAFMDIQPLTPGHLLVIPLRHSQDLRGLTPEEGGRLFQVGQRLADGLYRSGLRCEGVNYFLADGAAAGQDVFHVHLHVFPRFAGDGFGLKFPPTYRQLPAREELDRIAGILRAALEG